MKTRCTVRWKKDRFGVSAVLYAADGRSINVVHGYRRMPSAKKRRQVQQRLMRGCAELSRPEGGGGLEGLTRQHFEKIARVVRESDCADRCKLASAFAEMLQHENPSFDGARFRRAAGCR